MEAPDNKDPSGIERLLEVMARLRDPQTGCPWDREQSYPSIVPYTIEEAYEVADAIERRDFEALKAELGDLLFQVVFYAQIAKEEGRFDFDAVAAAAAEKMERRHPHVFGGAGKPKVESAAAQTTAWEAFKARERAAGGNGAPVSVLADVARALPALTRAEKLQKRAAREGFDWPEVAQVLDKIQEEIGELQAEVDRKAPHDRLEDELGDLLFACANLARKLKVDPETALRSTNAKFERRFRRIEQWLAESGKTPADSTLGEMDALWDRAKAEERG
ncbi:MAG: nucleoside triphosphate pyrophosphohydrolase [Gemmatimonas sp.]